MSKFLSLQFPLDWDRFLEIQLLLVRWTGICFICIVVQKIGSYNILGESTKSIYRTLLGEKEINGYSC